jgi:hypothetical protein
MNTPELRQTRSSRDFPIERYEPTPEHPVDDMAPERYPAAAASAEGQQWGTTQSLGHRLWRGAFQREMNSVTMDDYG